MSVLHDAVTLRHFAAAERLDIVKARHSTLAPPRWTEAVFTEIWDARDRGIDECATILEDGWLGSPHVAADLTEQLAIQRMRVKLGGSALDPAHAGEAESIYFAQKLNGAVATDDGPAYDFAANLLGSERVMDTVDILRSAVQLDGLPAADAAAICETIRARGRHLRAVHRTNLEAGYFM